MRCVCKINICFSRWYQSHLTYAISFGYHLISFESHHLIISVRYLTGTPQCTKYDRHGSISLRDEVNEKLQNFENRQVDCALNATFTHTHVHITRTKSRLLNLTHTNDEFESKMPLYAFT